MRCRVTMGPFHNQIYSALCGHLGALSFGYTIGYSSPALPQMMKTEKMFFNNKAAESWFGSIVTLGAVVGCLLAGWSVERRGRRVSLILTALPFVVGWVCIYAGNTINVLYLGRLLTGVGSGMVLVSAPLYVAETSSKELRGALGAGVQLSVALGIFLVYLLGATVNWRMLAFIGALMPFIGVLLLLRAPESPRFLLDTGLRAKAVVMLTWLRGSSAVAEEECRDMEEAMSSGNTGHASLSDIVRHSELLRPVVIAVMIMIFQQISGINVVMFYTVSIFETAGFKESGGMATVAIGAVQVFGTAAACVVMDRFGRRILLTIAGIGMAVSCLLLGVYYKMTLDQPMLVLSWSWLALLSLISYILAFSVGWGPIPMLLMSEIIPARARGAAASIASTTNWVFAFIVTKSFVIFQESLGLHGTFWLFSGFCVIAVVYVLKIVPETRGKTLEDIELCFVGKAPLVTA